MPHRVEGVLHDLGLVTDGEPGREELRERHQGGSSDGQCRSLLRLVTGGATLNGHSQATQDGTAEKFWKEAGP